MAFYIDTDKVETEKDSIDTISGQWEQLESDVAGFDTENEGNFDFDGAKSAIENNLKGAGIKFSNTVALLEAVLKVHLGTQDISGTGGDSGYSGSSSRGCGGCGGCGGGGGRSYNPSPSYVSELTGTVNGTETTKTELSAFELLQQHLKETGAIHAIGLLTLTKVDDVLSKLDVKEIKVSDIEKETKGKNTIIVEGISSSPECASYLVDVSEVTMDYDVSVKYVRLDKVIEDPNLPASELKDAASKLVNKTKDNIIDSLDKTSDGSKDDDFSALFVSSALKAAGYDKFTKLITTNVESLKKGFEDYKMYRKAEGETVPVPGSVIFYTSDDKKTNYVGIVDHVDEDGKIHTMIANSDKIVESSDLEVGDSKITGYGVLNKDVDSSSKPEILDQESYKKLTSLNSTSEIKLKDTPITVIIKDDKVVNSLQGVVSKIILEAAIKAAGIPKKTATTSE